MKLVVTDQLTDRLGPFSTVGAALTLKLAECCHLHLARIFAIRVLSGLFPNAVKLAV